LFFVIGFSIWDQSTEVAIVSLSPFWKQAAENISQILVGQLNIAAPFLIWIVVTFRRQDLAALGKPFASDPIKPIVPGGKRAWLWDRNRERR
jgi:hypothetical protein